MHFTVPLIALVAVASALPSDIIQRAAPDLSSSILQNFTVLAYDSYASNNSLNAQAPGNTPYTSPQLITLLQTSMRIERDLNSTAATVNKSAVFTQSESQQIYNMLNNTLRPIIFSVADNTIAHYGNIKASDQVSATKILIQRQRELVRELSNALIAKVVPPYVALGTSLRNTILAKYDSMIAKFSS